MDVTDTDFYNISDFIPRHIQFDHEQVKSTLDSLKTKC